MNERLNDLFSFFSYFEIQNIEYKMQGTKTNTVKYKNKIQNAKNVKRKRNKIIIESIKVSKDIISHSKYTLSIRA